MEMNCKDRQRKILGKTYFLSVLNSLFSIFLLIFNSAFMNLSNYEQQKTRTFT